MGIIVWCPPPKPESRELPPRTLVSPRPEIPAAADDDAAAAAAAADAETDADELALAVGTEIVTERLRRVQECNGTVIYIHCSKNEQ